MAKEKDNLLIKIYKIASHVFFILAIIGFAKCIIFGGDSYNASFSAIFGFLIMILVELKEAKQ